jgi:hypothetical protein
MNEKQQLDIFRAQTQNVRKLDKAKTQINRTINNALRKGDMLSVEIHTKALVLVFCAWVETQFSKIIHTPYGFTLDEICQIKKVYKSKGVEEGWKKCVELGLRRIPKSTKSNYIPNVQKKLYEIIREYIVEPSLIRNKIAHGQWVTALNIENSEINKDFSKKLQDINVISIEIWFGVYFYLAEIIEALIESPNKAFHRDYWVCVNKLEEFVSKTANWDLNEKIKHLKKLKLC